MNSVLIVEDDVVTRGRIVSAVQSCDTLTLVGAVGTVAEAMQALQTHRPRVVLIDLGLSDGSGLAIISEVERLNYGGQSLVITVFGDERSVVAALRAGAKGYLLKDSPYETITDHILTLLEGGSPINPKVARYLLGQFDQSQQTAQGQPNPGDDASLEGLSEREREILLLIAKGYRRGEIAQLLSLSPNTVATYTKRIYGKLSIHSNVEAAQRVASLGLVSTT